MYTNSNQKGIDIVESGEGGSHFNFDKYFTLLKTKKFGHVLLHSHTLPSTQTFFKTHLQAIENVVVLADVQQEGKGWSN